MNKYSVRICVFADKPCVTPLDDTVDYYDLTVVISGKLHYIVDNREVILTARDAILIPPGSHRVRLCNDMPAQYFSINFFADEIPDIPLYIQNCGSELKDMIYLQNKISKKRSDTYFEQKQILTLQLMLMTLKEFADKKKHSPHVNRILQYISEHFTEKITLEDIARSVFLTVPYCCNLVKKELNLTIYEIILKERILLAREYILQGEKPLSDIPYLCGFSDYSHFSKSFKKYTGILPSKYKKH